MELTQRWSLHRDGTHFGTDAEKEGGGEGGIIRSEMKPGVDTRRGTG